MEREKLQVEYLRFGLAVESRRVIWIEDSSIAFTLERNRFASKFQFWMEECE